MAWWIWSGRPRSHQGQNWVADSRRRCWVAPGVQVFVPIPLPSLSSCAPDLHRTAHGRSDQGISPAKACIFVVLRADGIGWLMWFSAFCLGCWVGGVLEAEAAASGLVGGAYFAASGVRGCWLASMDAWAARRRREQVGIGRAHV